MIWLSMCIFCIGLLLFMVFEAKQNRVCRTTLEFNQFPESFGEVKIFFISDIHKRKVSQKIIDEVREETDIVIIGGDLCEKGVPFSRIKENLLLLRSVGPTYFVWGNNDYEVNHRELDSLLLSLDITILDNTATRFESEMGEEIAILGIDDIKSGRPHLGYALLDAGDDVKFKILVSHNPEIIKEIKNEYHIHLVLSGHTHGGQIRILNMGLYKKGGIEKNGLTTLLVSNGYGTTELPLRLGAPPETHLLTIKNRKK